MIRANTVVIGCFFVGNKRFASLTIPALIAALVYQTSLFKLLPNILDCGLVLNVSRTNKISAIDLKSLDEVQKTPVNTVGILLRSHA